MPGISRYQRAFVRGQQPYHRGKWHLAALANLSNQDKHRLITPVHLFASTLRRRHFKPTKGRIVSWRVLLPEGRPVHERTPFLEVIVNDPDTKVELYASITTTVTFEERSDHYRRPRDLEEVGEKVAGIVGESARRWGRSQDELASAEWIIGARKALGLPSTKTGSRRL